MTLVQLVYVRVRQGAKVNCSVHYSAELVRQQVMECHTIVCVHPAPSNHIIAFGATAEREGGREGERERGKDGGGRKGWGGKQLNRMVRSRASSECECVPFRV